MSDIGREVSKTSKPGDAGLGDHLLGNTGLNLFFEPAKPAPLASAETQQTVINTALMGTDIYNTRNKNNMSAFGQSGLNVSDANKETAWNNIEERLRTAA